MSRVARRCLVLNVHPKTGHRAATFTASRRSIGRYEIGSAFRGSSALHAVGDSYVLLTRPLPQFNTVELRFQFRYAAHRSRRACSILNSAALWFSAAGVPATEIVADRRKVIRRSANSARPPAIPAWPANHDAHRMFQAHRATGHRRGLPTRFDRAVDGRYRLPR